MPYHLIYVNLLIKIQFIFNWWIWIRKLRFWFSIHQTYPATSTHLFRPLIVWVEIVSLTSQYELYSKGNQGFHQEDQGFDSSAAFLVWAFCFTCCCQYSKLFHLLEGGFSLELPAGSSSVWCVFALAVHIFQRECVLGQEKASMVVSPVNIKEKQTLERAIGF